MSTITTKAGTPGGWIAIGVLCLLLAAALFGAYQGWTEHSGGVELPDWGYAFLAVGIVFGLLVGCGLMALAFYSSRHGYDEPIIVQPNNIGASEVVIESQGSTEASQSAALGSNPERTHS